MEINSITHFNQIKLAQERHVKELIQKIETKGGLGTESIITVNIEGCTTDYPATPKLLDYFLNHLVQQEGMKELTIVLDGLGNKLIYILYILVLEGSFFGINDKIENEEEVNKWETIINNKLMESNIFLKIIFTPDNKEYTYGKQNN